MGRSRAAGQRERGRHAKPSRWSSPFFRAIAAAAAVVVAFSGVLVGATAAQAALGDDGQITLSKNVNGIPSDDVSPGETFTYGFLVGCDDWPCINAVLDDQIPSELAGFTITDLFITPAAAGTPSLSGCSVGGTVPVAPATCDLHVDFDQTLLGNASYPNPGDPPTPQYGIPAGTTYSVYLQVTVPVGLPATWPHNGLPIDNTATADADTSIDPADDTATVTVNVPVVVDVTPSKSWDPSSQLYNPGQAAEFTIGAQNASNLPAASLVLQDPVVAPDGAASLDPSNPFTFVDFTGLCAPSTLPQGADLVQADLYVLSGGTWNWVLGTPAGDAATSMPVTADPVGGIRLTYTSTGGDAIAAMGTASAQCVSVEQRSDNRTTGDPLVATGATVNNTVGATVTVTGRPPVSRNASAALSIGPLNVVVEPGKVITPAVIPAGGTFDVNLGARNGSNGPLTSLTITEPNDPLTPFLTEDMTFDGFTSWTWPTGATDGTFTWHIEGGPDVVVTGLTLVSPAPAPPVLGPGERISGFTVNYTGSIAAGTSAGMIYRVETAADMIVPPAESELFTNVIGVSGTNPAGTDTRTAQDDVRIYYPEVELEIEKTVRPGLVTPGGTVVAELETTTSGNSARVNPTQIVIEDYWDGSADTDFWDAFRARSLPFIAIPSDSTLTVRYTTTTPPAAPVWTDLVVATTGTGGLYSNDLSALPGGDTADDITGFQFVFDSTAPAGFSQGTIVKPNIVFEAAGTLRDGITPTAPAVETQYPFHNVATADGEGVSGGVTVPATPVDDDATTDIIRYGGGGGPGPGPGTVRADKEWVQSNWTSLQADPLGSQSGATARTMQGWGVTVPGYTSVVLSDPAPGAETTPASTVFQAFDLTGIRPITFAQDPLLNWDIVSGVEIYVGGVWVSLSPIGGGTWMNGTGFKGYNPPAGPLLTQLRDATGVRITVEENTPARTANAASPSPDPTAPAVGSGVASGAGLRPMWLQWELRNADRVPTGSGWVTAAESFNGGTGIITNAFQVTGNAPGGPYTDGDTDDIGLLDNGPNVGGAKSAATSPVTTPPTVVVPHSNNVPESAYPTVRFTVDAWNASAARASYIRVTDPVPCATVPGCVSPANDWDPDVFTGNTYDPAENPFERFTVTGVSFVVPGTVPVDPATTQVALWHYDEGTGTTSVTTTTMAALALMTAPALADVVGIGITYQSTDPSVTGGLIPFGNSTTNVIRMQIDTQLRKFVRSDDTVRVPGGIEIENDMQAQSYDPILAAAATPNVSRLAPVRLSGASLDVTASKSVSPGTIVETSPGTPVVVTLGATSGTATASPETVMLSDTTAGFWSEFQLVAVGTVTRPAGADYARIDVVLDGDDPSVPANWVEGTGVLAPANPALPASLTLPADLERITGIRYVFFNDPARPFSATAPAATWSSQAGFEVELRPGVAFPGSVANTVDVSASNAGLPPATADDDATITLSRGTPRIDVQKEPVGAPPTKLVEPGVPFDWTLEFENTGDAFYAVNEVLDDLGPNLRYDGTEPTYATNGAAMPITGIAVTQAAPDQMTFTFPTGAVMAPGDWYRITVKLILLPGLTPGQQAVNAFIVDTDVTFGVGACTNTSGNGQGILAGVDPNQCGTTNFVGPQSGPLLYAEKEVRGEVDGTLVDGASNVNNPALPCVPSGAGFYRGACLPYTVIGSADEWRIGATNTGTTAYNSMMFVDALPTPGDRLLATGGARGSQWRPVFDLGFGIVPDGVPAGTTTTIEVTTTATPCTGPGPGSAWPGDPTCAAAAWQLLAGYAGAAEDVTGIRITLVFATPLPAGGTAHFLYRTVNTPWETGDVPTAEAVHPELSTGPSPRTWNQVGVIVNLAGGGDIRRAPERVGVQLVTGSAAVEKTVSGVTSLAPAQVTVDVTCTVPGAVGGGRAPVDLGASAVLPVPTGGTARLDGIPLGAECDIEESGSLGAFGEVERTPGGAQTVEILTMGTQADPVPVAQSVSVNNRYVAMPVTGFDVRVPLALTGFLLGAGVLLQLLVAARRRRSMG